MKIIELQNIIERILEVLEIFGEQHSCILASALVIETIKRRHQNVEIFPLAVEVKILDSIQKNQLENNLPLTGDQRVVGYRKSKSTKDLWAGHLIVLVKNIENRNLLIDLTIHQIGQIATDIEISPLVFPVPLEFCKYKTNAGSMNNGNYLIYKPYPEDKSYEESSIWNDTTYINQMIEKIEKTLTS